MATFIDVTGLAAFSKIFVFVLVLLALYAIFASTKAFASNQWISWLIAFIIAIFVILSDVATNIIQYIAPWFAVLFIFVTFIIIASKIFGANVSDFGEMKWVLIVLVVIIFVVGILFYLRQSVNVPGDIDEDGNAIDTNYEPVSNFIFHPKVMGIIFILLVAVFTVALMAGKSA